MGRGSARTRSRPPSARAAKRGDGVKPVSIDDGLTEPADTRGVDVARLDDALSALSAIDSRLGQVVELRFFAGLSMEETAEALDLSVATVGRDWKTARIWLRRELKRGDAT